MPDRICSFPDCGRKLKATGLCAGHYWQQSKGRPLFPIRETTRADELRELIAEETDECILVLWPSSKTHPIVYLNGRYESVGAAALILSGSPRPLGLDCCHDPAVCNNGRCVNLRHVRWDTPSANSMDRLIADTHVRGERNVRAILTEAQVREIRDLAHARERGEDWLTQHQIGARYGIDYTTVSAIKRGKNWAWLD